jgi:glycine/D-amino acid oxidase-like deaminating enzyme/nitrite reductase/ring-hydroxylating ferredoxin subunit
MPAHKEFAGPKDTTSYWRASQAMPRFPKLDRDQSFDIVVIGAGIAGVTAAYLLKREGARVALIDRGRAVDIDTCQTSGHLSCVLDTPMTQLVNSLGDDHARAAWDAGLSAIATIDQIVRQEKIDCDFAWVPGYIHAPASRAASEKDYEQLRREAREAARLGFDARFIESVPLMDRPGVEIDGQARFNPRKYLRALLEKFDGGGSADFENTEATEVTDGAQPITVVTDGGKLACRDVVIATHNPITGLANIASATILQTGLALYTSYVAGGRAPKGSVPDALFWDTDDPYKFLRIDPHPAYDYVIYGGEDHKTGQVDDTRECVEKLEAAFRSLVPGIEIQHHWSGQVIETHDGLPFIGFTRPHQFIATGFSGNGLTFGTLSGVMAADALTARDNPWRALFDATRTKVAHGVWDYIKENADYPYYMVRDRFAGDVGKSLRSVPRGSGKILELKGHTVAAHRAHDGTVTLLSPVCTHMGCRVRWNQLENSWDCPCHGSRFGASGHVMSGPAEKPLPPVDINDK